MFEFETLNPEARPGYYVDSAKTGRQWGPINNFKIAEFDIGSRVPAPSTVSATPSGSTRGPPSATSTAPGGNTSGNTGTGRGLYSEQDGLGRTFLGALGEYLDIFIMEIV